MSKNIYREYEVPEPVRWILKNATRDELICLDNISKSGDFDSFVSLVSRFKRHNKEEVYSYKMKDEKDLAYFRAAKVGEVAGLDSILIACEASYVELKKRSSK